MSILLIDKAEKYAEQLAIVASEGIFPTDNSLRRPVGWRPGS